MLLFLSVLTLLIHEVIMVFSLSLKLHIQSFRSLISSTPRCLSNLSAPVRGHHFNSTSSWFSFSLKFLPSWASSSTSHHCSKDSGHFPRLNKEKWRASWEEIQVKEWSFKAREIWESYKPKGKGLEIRKITTNWARCQRTRQARGHWRRVSSKKMQRHFSQREKGRLWGWLEGRLDV